MVITEVALLSCLSTSPKEDEDEDAVEVSTSVSSRVSSDLLSSSTMGVAFLSASTDCPADVDEEDGDDDSVEEDEDEEDEVEDAVDCPNGNSVMLLVVDSETVLKKDEDEVDAFSCSCAATLWDSQKFNKNREYFNKF